MNEKEMMELNAWIAEHVMGWIWWRFDAPNYVSNQKHNKREKWCQLVAPNEQWVHKPEYRGIKCGCAIRGMKDYTDLSTFKPTTDPAAAMQVLAKCLKYSKIGFSMHGNGEGFGIIGKNDVYESTLPLAISLFAKKLFSK